MPKNSLTKLIQTCDVADDFIANYYSGKYEDEDRRIIIIQCLVSLEIVLDAGRAIIDIEERSPNQAEWDAIISRMNNVRGEIRKMIDNFPNQELLKTCFHIKARGIEGWLNKV